jgi:hypothetical protein
MSTTLVPEGQNHWRATFYIDGFNLYHAIDGLRDNRLKWLDLWSLCHSFLTEDDQLILTAFMSDRCGPNRAARLM